MNQTKGFLYGHYDSRGGTMFVIAPTRKEADELYARTGGWADCLEPSEWQGICDEDFIKAVTLHHAKPLPTEYTDLENGKFLSWETEPHFEGGGNVIVTGNKKQWPPVSEEEDAEEPMTDEETNGCNFFNGESSDLEWVAQGDKPVVFSGGYSWPRWDDDAFAFVVVTKDNIKAIAGE